MLFKLFNSFPGQMECDNDKKQDDFPVCIRIRKRPYKPTWSQVCLSSSSYEKRR